MDGWMGRSTRHRWISGLTIDVRWPHAFPFSSVSCAFFDSVKELHPPTVATTTAVASVVSTGGLVTPARRTADMFSLFMGPMSM